MVLQSNFQIFDKRFIKSFILVIVSFVLIITTVFLDFLYANFQQTSFYFSESLLFSSYWLLYIPSLQLLQKKIIQIPYFFWGILLVVFTIVLHLVFYPALVWGLSNLFYAHTFSYSQTFKFGLTNYFIATLLIYTACCLLFKLKKSYFRTPETLQENLLQKSLKYTASLFINGPNNTKIIIDINSVFYFSAKSPYVAIHQVDKKYLQTQTLKALVAKLDGDQFIRIHKSYIINLSKVVSYTSRLNGDYDVILKNGICLRLSRFYATAFKEKFLTYTSG